MQLKVRGSESESECVWERGRSRERERERERAQLYICVWSVSSVCGDDSGYELVNRVSVAAAPFGDSATTPPPPSASSGRHLRTQRGKKLPLHNDEVLTLHYEEIVTSLCLSIEYTLLSVPLRWGLCALFLWFSLSHAISRKCGRSLSHSLPRTPSQAGLRETDSVINQ